MLASEDLRNAKLSSWRGLLSVSKGGEIIMNPNYVVPTFPPEMQNISPGQAAALGMFFASFALAIIVFALIFYVIFAICLMKLAKKTGVADGWWAWIPILNIFLLLRIAGKEWWWVFLFFVPLINIVIGIILWMAIAERVGKPSWWGVLIIVPLIGQFVPLYLAFSKSETTEQPAQPQVQPTVQSPVQPPPTPQ